VISSVATEAFSTMFVKAVEEQIKQKYQSETWSIHDIKDTEHIRAREFIVLTMCSFDFRLFLTAHFTCNTPTIQLVADSLGTSVDKVTREKFYDYMGEFGNTFCGAMKREVGQIFPHLGMSTPDRLEERSFQHFHHMKYEYARYISAQSDNRKIALFFGIHVCPYGDLDFEMPHVIEETTTGEIELF
jgi:hypothetical protein